MAQETEPPADAVQADRTDQGDDFHGVIYVTAGGLKRLDMLAGTSVIEADDLQRNSAGQIGSGGDRAGDDMNMR